MAWKLNPKQREYLFWTVCIPFRTLVTNLVRFNRSLNTLVRLLGTVLAYRWLNGLEAGNEGAFGGVAWWADTRPMHGHLWAFFVITGDWRFVAADTLAGMANWFYSVSNGRRLSSRM